MPRKFKNYFHIDANGGQALADGAMAEYEK